MELPRTLQDVAANARTVIKAILQTVVITTLLVVAIQVGMRLLTGKSATPWASAIAVPIALLIVRWRLGALQRKSG